MIKRVRLLPVLVAVASLALAARLTDVWQGFAAMAQENPAPQEESPRSEPQGEGAVEDTAQVDPIAAPSGVFELPPDPLSMTDEEVALLQSLSERREEIDRRARRLEEREILLQAAERRIEEKVAGLKSLQKVVEDLLNQQKEQTESQYNSLVKIYENMKPKSAARIFEELELEVLLPVIARMKERKIAPILAKMNAEKAKTITTELAQRRRLPENG
jgi:flagellar motility protein MotE (MotC chaperone)